MSDRLLQRGLVNQHPFDRIIGLLDAVSGSVILKFVPQSEGIAGAIR